MAVKFTSSRGTFEINWRADELDAEKLEACRRAIDECNEYAADDARSNHPAYPPASEPGERYAERTGGVTASIFSNPAIIDPDDWVWGEWGVYDVVPALFLEFGTYKMEPRPFLYPAWDKAKHLFWINYYEARALTGIPSTSIAYGKVGRGPSGRFTSLARLGVRVSGG